MTIKTEGRLAELLTGIKGELVRKLLHFLVAIVPFMAMIDKTLTMLLLGTGILFYTVMEKLRQEGVYVLIISDVTVFTSREKEKGKFVLGPVTLALGAMLALALYPEPASRIAIYALAFGDGFASLAGKLIGGVTLPLTRGKTLAGTLACFLTVGLIAFRILGNPLYALLIGVVAAFLEALPTEDLDNILLPMGTGLFVSVLLGLFPLG
ncbi:MAG: phosphatidate cytidylyltransferase [Spirochaetales bacterium]|nr:phosphatidate cytidylyltransferase [Spirochaetales bacterium]